MFVFLVVKSCLMDEKSRRMRWALHVAHLCTMIYMYKICLEN